MCIILKKITDKERNMVRLNMQEGLIDKKNSSSFVKEGAEWNTYLKFDIAAFLCRWNHIFGFSTGKKIFLG